MTRQRAAGFKEKDKTMRAPAGGTISIINDKHYDGGQFLPEHGLFCGKKGAKRQALWNSVAEGMKADLGGDKMFEVMKYCGGGEWQRVGVAIAADAETASNAFQGKHARRLSAWAR
jgi:hypothetical protein